MSEVEASSYAVVFRTHFWDEFTGRQLRRVQAQIGRGRLFILVDETRGKVKGVPEDIAFGVTDKAIVKAGYVDNGQGSVQWFSGDVPLYLFQEAHPGFDFYVQLEYDVCVDVALDELVDRIAAGSVDMVALKNEVDDDHWHWMPSCIEAYDPSEVIHQLICFSVFSNRALVLLKEGRLQQAEAYRLGRIKTWPYCEGYLATQAVRLKLNVAELSEFGDVSSYRWWPPYFEAELPDLCNKEFIHPVLEPSRGLPSLFKYQTHIRLMDYVNPHSWVHKKLRKLGFLSYIKVISGKLFWNALRQTFQQRFRIGLA